MCHGQVIGAVGVRPGLGDDDRDGLLRSGEQAPDVRGARSQIHIRFDASSQVAIATAVRDQVLEAGQVRRCLDQAMERGIDVAQVPKLDRDDAGITAKMLDDRPPSRAGRAGYPEAGAASRDAANNRAAMSAAMLCSRS